MPAPKKRKRRWFEFRAPSAPPVDPLRFNEAVDFFRARVPIVKHEWLKLGTAARQRGFAVADVAHLDVLNDVWLALDDSIAQGESFGEFKKAVTEKLVNEWQGSVENPPARIETIFRTNVMQANNAGRHAQMTNPVVAERRPYWQYVDIDDQRECPICNACHGTILPADDAWWKTHSPPLHFNATPRDTVISTERGPMAIGDVPVGIRVLTHRGRWQRATATLHKIVRNYTVKALHLSTGGILRVTEDHPVLVDLSLTSDAVSWKRAGDVKVGDKLFQHLDEMTGKVDVSVGNPDDAPPFADEPSITDEIGGAPLGVPVVFAVHLDGHARIYERKVEHVGADGQLRDGRREDASEVMFLWGHLISEMADARSGRTFQDAAHGDRVVVRHPDAMSGMDRGSLSAHAPCPMLLATRAILGRVGVGDRNLIQPVADGDPMTATPNGENPVSDSVLPLNRSDAAALLPVFNGDDGFNFVPVPVVNWHSTTVISIVDEVKSGELCDLSVEEDESYVASGVIVHNCRCKTRPLTVKQAEAMGVTLAPPMEAAQEGFGAPPQEVAPPFQVDLSKYPPEVAAAAIAKMGGTP